MALTHETGAGLSTADSYCSVADADTYHTDRGGAAWAALSNERKEQCLRLATDYMIGAYVLAWQGARATAGQALDWPRRGVVFQQWQGQSVDPRWIDNYDIFVLPTIVPPAVRDACAVLALKANAGPLVPDLSRAIKRQKVGPIETEYADYSPQSKRYLAVDRMLAPYMASSNPYAARLERG